MLIMRALVRCTVHGTVGLLRECLGCLILITNRFWISKLTGQNAGVPLKHDFSCFRYSVWEARSLLVIHERAALIGQKCLIRRRRCSQPQQIFQLCILLTNSSQTAMAFLTNNTQFIALTFCQQPLNDTIPQRETLQLWSCWSPNENLYFCVCTLHHSYSLFLMRCMHCTFRCLTNASSLI